jgi:hypothetical protein
MAEQPITNHVMIPAVCAIRHHTDHRDERHSWLIGDGWPTHVFLTGSDDEVLAFADRIYAAVTQHRAEAAA